MTEIAGHCETCEFKQQEWVVEDGKRTLDTFCGLLDCFVAEKSYCWLYAPLTKV